MERAVVVEKIRPPTVRALDRQRLDERLALRPGDHRVGLVVAPAGAGKTTLLARVWARAGFPIAWYQLDATDGDEAQVLTYLNAALQRVLPGFGEHRTVDEIAAALGERREPVGLILDDLHTIHGSPAEAAVARLARYFPRQCVLLLASRREPGFDLSRLRLAGDLVEIDSDALRFRTWEVEQLFRDVYDSPLPPVELAELARRTDGWAAGLQLFHLATAGKPPAVRKATLHALATRSRLVREYLTRNVLEDLPDELASFLLDTCVLTLLTPGVCDALRGTTGSGALLAELDRRQIFTTALDDCGTYRYHDVLRSHLQGILVEGQGDSSIRTRFRRAGEVLEAAGQDSDAVIAYARAGAADAVSALLRRAGSDLALEPGDWIEALPPSIAENDAWVSLAAARWHLRAGRWLEAADEYLRAEEQFGTEAGAEICRTERSAMLAFGEPGASNAARPDRWDQVLLAAVQRMPTAYVEPLDRESPAMLAAGLAAMLAGWPVRAASLLEGADDPETGPMTASAARLAAAVAPHWAPGSPPAGEGLADLVSSIEQPGGPWLSILGAASLELVARNDAGRPATELAAVNEPWSALCGRYLGAVGRLRTDPDAAADDFEAAAKEARGLRSGTMEAWCRAGSAYVAASAAAPTARELAQEAEAFARAAGVPGARAVAFAALASCSPSADNERLARLVADECGLEIAIPVPRLPGPSAASAELRCLGGLQLRLGGERVVLDGLKPRWRSLLGLLAIDAGRAVHRDTIIEALWPGSDEAAARRSLQVGVSGVRSCLDAGNSGNESVLARVGDAYALRLPKDGWIDWAALEQGLAAGRAARREGDIRTAVEALRRALSLYTGELLPEEGPAEWLIDKRERLRTAAADAAGELAANLLELGEAVEAERAAARGLSIDRYRDDLWRLRLASLERSGDVASLKRARAAYEHVLADLGVT